MHPARQAQTHPVLIGNAAAQLRAPGRTGASSAGLTWCGATFDRESRLARIRHMVSAANAAADEVACISLNVGERLNQITTTASHSALKSQCNIC